MVLKPGICDPSPGKGKNRQENQLNRLHGHNFWATNNVLLLESKIYSREFDSRRYILIANYDKIVVIFSDSLPVSQWL